MKTKTIKKIYILILISILLISSILSGCQKLSSTTPYDGITKTNVFFDTLTTITIYGKNKSESDILLDNCFDLCQKYENMFSERVTDSDIYKINHANGNPCTVSAETINLISSAIDYSKKSNGLFDITIFSVSSLWDFHEETMRIPSDFEIETALKNVDYKDIEVDQTNNSVTLLNKNATLDIGGIAKGYIADIISDYLLSENVTGAIVNIGGDIKLIGNKPNNSEYKIGIKDPFETQDVITCAHLKGDIALATSGTYERKITFNDKEYSHILDPRTGYPVSTDIISTSVITSNAIDADTLCTIAILLGSDEAFDFIEKTPNTEAIIITTNGTILKTSGIPKYIN